MRSTSKLGVSNREGRNGGAGRLRRALASLCPGSGYPKIDKNASRIPSRIFKEVLGTSSSPEVLPALLVSTVDKQQAPSCFSGQGNLIWQSLFLPLLPFKLCPHQIQDKAQNTSYPNGQLQDSTLVPQRDFKGAHPI